MKNFSFLSLIASGASADVVRLGSGKVLKLFHRHVDPGVMLREIDGAKRASAEGLLVPRPIGWQEVEDRRGIVFEELEGAPLLHATGGWRIDRARHALRKLAECHARIHQCSADGLIHHQHDILHVRLLSADIDESVRRAAIDQLVALPRDNSLCHGDFHPGNAVETRQGVAAIDWASGCAGNPAGDVVRTEYLLRYGLHGNMKRLSRSARWFRHLAADFYLRHYLRISGMPAEQLAAWRLPVAVASLGSGSRMYRPALLSALATF